MSDEDTPELFEVIDAAVGSFADAMLIGLPGVVTAYDVDSNRASVQAVVMTGEFGEDGSRVGVPIAQFTDIPVALFGSGKHLIKFPIKKGDQCWLQFSSRCLTAWKSNGTRVSDPLDDRRHHKADVVMIPAVFIHPEDGDATIEFTDDGKINAGGTSPLATKDDIDALANYITTHIHPAPGGTTSPPTGPVPSASGTTKLRGG